MENKYLVQFNLDAYLSLVVSASTKEEAEQKALEKFHNMSKEEILNLIGGYYDITETFTEEL